MNKSSNHGKSRLGGRGFYVALAVGLLALGGIAVANFGEALFVKQPAEPDEPQGEHQAVERPVTDQPDDRKTTTTATAATTTATTTTAVQPPADLYVLPLTNTVLKGYSAAEPVYSLTMGDWRVHSGTDFAGEANQPVRALADGRVTSVETDPLWGGRVTVDHGMGVLSYYSGVKPAVSEGDTVQVGQSIGTLAEIPCEAADGPHLHLEMTVDGRSVDPVNAIGREVRYTDDTAQ